MKAFFCHLSDFHIRSTDNPFDPKWSKLAGAVWSSARGSSKQFLLLTGDLAFSGQESEYRVFEQILQAILAAAPAHIENPSVRVFAIPGNHDCDFSGQDSVRDFMLASNVAELAQKAASPDFLTHLLQPQRNFFAFLARVGMPPQPSASLGLWSVDEDLDGQVLRVICLNSAVGSALLDPQGRLFLVEANIAALDQASPADLTLALIHHPINWLEASNGLLVSKALDCAADVVFSGHQHVEVAFERARLDPPQTACIFFEGAAINPAGEDRSGFRTLTIDPVEMSYQQNRYEWSGAEYALVDASDSAPLIRRTRGERGRLGWTKEFESHLSDPGAGFSHPRREVLRLSDFFVAPDLLVSTLEPATGDLMQSKRIESQDSLRFLLDHRLVLVTGDETSGKTALTKQLVRASQHAGEVPILVDGSELKSGIASDFPKFLRAVLAAQYGSAAVDGILQLPREQKRIVVDDFHRCNANRAGQAALVRAMRAEADYVCVLADGLFRFDELSRKTENAAAFVDFDFAEIREMSFRLRRSLISRWSSIGTERVLNGSDLAQEVVRAERMVALLLGKKLLPSFPFTVLTILQLAEAGRETGRDSGSYGSMYEALIASCLAVGSSAAETSINMAFLGDLSKEMFDQDRAVLTVTEVQEVGRRYEQRIHIALGLESRLTGLEKKRILRRTALGWEFRYPYIYYYFVARWFRSAIASDQVHRATLLHLADRVYSDRNTNILVFYLSLSQDFAVVERVLSNAEQIYGNLEPCSLEADVEFCNQLFKGKPEPALQLPSELDSPGPQDGPSDDCNDELEYEEQLGDVIKLNIAFKTLQILGQFVRSFPGQLDGQLKRRIVDACYLLGLRALAAVLCVAETNQDVLRAYFAELMKERRSSLSEAEAQRAGVGALLWLTRGCAFSVVKRISNAVGLQELEQTYQAALADRPNTAVRIVDIAIKFDHFRQTPVLETIGLYGGLTRNYFASVVLRDIVSQHLIQFPVAFAARQKLTEAMGLGGPEARYIDSPQRMLERPKKG